MVNKFKYDCQKYRGEAEKFKVQVKILSRKLTDLMVGDRGSKGGVMSESSFTNDSKQYSNAEDSLSFELSREE